jgi:outer membrane protein TolC
MLFILANLTIAQQKPLLKLGFMLDSRSIESEFESFAHEVNSLLKEQYEVQFLDPLVHKNDFERAKINYNVLKDSLGADIIIGVGLTSARFFYITDNIEVPSIIIGAVNSSLINIPKDQTTSGKPNVNFMVLPNSYEEDLQDLNMVTPVKTMGIIVDEEYIKQLPVEEFFMNYFSTKDQEYVLIPFNDMKIDEHLLDSVDAVYVTDLLFIDTASAIVLRDQINSRSLPSFTANGYDFVEAGFFMTNKPNGLEEQFTRKVALQIEAIASGENAGDLPIHIEYNHELTINYTTMKKIGLELRFSILGQANILGSDYEDVERTYNIVDVFNQVLGNNLQLQAQQKDVILASEDVRLSKSTYLPNVTAEAQGVYLDPEMASIGGGRSPEYDLDGIFTVKQVLYSQEATTGIKIKNELNEAEKQNYSAKELDLIVEAAGAYFQTLILKTNVAIQNQNLQLTKQNFAIAEENFNAGASGKSDVLRFKSQLAQNVQELINASNKLNQSYLTLNQLMNNEIDMRIGISDADMDSELFKNYDYELFEELFDSPRLVPVVADFFIDEAYRNSPELKSLEYNLAATELNYKLNKNGRYIPTFALQGQYNLGLVNEGKGSEPNLGFPEVPQNNYNVGLNVSLPIFNQNTRNINQQIAQVQGEQLSVQKDNVKQQFEKNIREVLYDLMGNISNIETSRISEEAAKQSLELTQSAYQNGAVPIIQLIDAQNNYLQAKQASATAMYQFLISVLTLERYMGYFIITHSTEENELFFQRARDYIISNF